MGHDPRALVVAGCCALLLAPPGCTDDGGGGEPPLAGDPEAPVAGAVPAMDFEPREEDYADGHPDLPGMRISWNTALVVFAVETTIGEANEVLRGVRAEVVGVIAGVAGEAPAVLIVRTDTSSHEEMTEVVARLRGAPVVLHAAQDVVLSEDLVPRPNGGFPPDWSWDLPPVGGNWGLELIRMPQAWNLNDAIRRTGRTVDVWVLDTGFDDGHTELASASLLTPGPFRCHGTHVAGIIGASYDNTVGVDGANPFASLGLHATFSVAHVTSILSAATAPPVVNISMGLNWYQYGDPPPLDPRTNEAAEDLLTELTGVFDTGMRAAASRGELPVIVASAGNSSGPCPWDSTRPHLGRFPACWNSAYTAGALWNGLANVIVVEAIADPGRPALSWFSNVEGHLSAPGSDVLSTAYVESVLGPCTGRYETLSGTSMAAPHVAGLVSYLYALDPSLPRPTLDDNPVLDLLLETSVPVEAGTSNRIDAFAAVMALNPDLVVPLLVDVDDGTPDGNDRSTRDDARGDGAVDMSDFRRFRDWLLQVEDPPDLALDGLADHPKRDLNGDGVVGASAAENVYPRGDFNGDGVLSRDAVAAVPRFEGEVTDLEVLQSRFADEQYDGTDLPGLIDSGDVAVSAEACLEGRDGATALVSIRLAGSETPLWTGTHSAEAPLRIYTLAADGLPYTIEMFAVASDDAVLGRAEESFVVGLGEDLAWSPSCGPFVSALRPDRGGPGDEVTIDGVGFGLDLAELGVRFEDPGDPSRSYEAPIDRVTLEEEIAEIVVLVPAEARGGSLWEVYVLVGPTGAEVASNRLPFLIRRSRTLAASGSHTCALVGPSAPGTVACWGMGMFGQLGNGALDERHEPVLVAGLSDAVEVSPNVTHSTVALRSEGAVASWGWNAYGLLGDGLLTHADCSGQDCSSVPVAVLGIDAAAMVRGCGVHLCAVLASGQALCWGRNAAGQLGDGTTDDSAVPVEVVGLDDAVDLSGSTFHTCALRASGRVVCWGGGDEVPLGDGSSWSSPMPVEVAGLEDAVQIGAGLYHTCALRQTGQVVCWGVNTYGQLGDGTSETRLTPVETSGLDDAVQISVGAQHSCAIRASGQAMCWGNGGAGQVGDGLGGLFSEPVAVVGLDDAVELSAAMSHTCARSASRGLLCWGDNDYGQLGTGDTRGTSAPVAVVGMP